MTTRINISVMCKGRNVAREEVLENPIEVDVTVLSLENRKGISIYNNCTHNRGDHGHRCTASSDERVSCPYAVDLPGTLDKMKF